MMVGPGLLNSQSALSKSYPHVCLPRREAVCTRPGHDLDLHMLTTKPSKRSTVRLTSPFLIHRVNVLDSFDTDENASIPELPQTPSLSSEAGDSLQDPGSVVSDILSPPSISSRPPAKKKSVKRLCVCEGGLCSCKMLLI